MSQEKQESSVPHGETLTSKQMGEVSRFRNDSGVKLSRGNSMQRFVATSAI